MSERCFRCGHGDELHDYDGDQWICTPCLNNIIHRRTKESVHDRYYCTFSLKCGDCGHQKRMHRANACAAHTGRTFCPCAKYREQWVIA